MAEVRLVVESPEGCRARRLATACAPGRVQRMPAALLALVDQALAHALDGALANGQLLPHEARGRSDSVRATSYFVA
ncbi:MAG TPA: hypothetical protein VJY65_01740 [Chloroflexota bacterium]|nr:hypothetical protein [Chloroflexota bacterium]